MILELNHQPSYELSEIQAIQGISPILDESLKLKSRKIKNTLLWGENTKLIIIMR